MFADRARDSQPHALEVDRDPDAESLPVVRPERDPLLVVRPADEPLDVDAVAAHLRRLHHIGGPVTRPTVFDRLRRRPSTAPTLECRLTADTRADGSLSYAFGIDDPTLRRPLTRVLRGLFPDSYEFEQTGVGRPLTGVDPSAIADDAVAAVEFSATATRRHDWQTALTPFASLLGRHGRAPLAGVVEAMAESAVPVVYQALVRPLPDWSSRADDRRIAIESGHDAPGGSLVNVVFGEPEAPADALSSADRTRLASLERRDPTHSFAVTARAAAIDPGGDGDRAGHVIEALASAFAPVSGPTHAIDGRVTTGTAARAVLESIRDARPTPPRYERLATRLPTTRNTSPTVVVDAAELGSLIILGGSALTVAGARSVAPTPTERTAIPRPPSTQLERYREPGLTLGHPLTQDGDADPDAIALPPSLQPLHLAWFGKTGAGKSTALVTAMLDNVAATDGASILIDPKGDGLGHAYLRAHYARFGHLDDVYYFDCAAVLPAFSFFDIRRDLAAGISRTTAVEDRVDHYIEVLQQVMGRDRFEQAVRSPDVIRYLVKALFDPVNGTDAYSHRDLHEAARLLHERQTAPAVSDTDLETALAGVVANRARTFDEIMAGVANRIEKIPVDQRLARIFNHVPDGADDPHFDLADRLDERGVVIFDTGGLRSEAQRVFAVVVLSNLWSALRRRTQRDPDGEHPLVNLYLEEAASIAATDLLGELLAHARGFDCSVTLAMQFPAQLRTVAADVYDELLNNVSTVVTGNVPADAGLADRLATDDMPPAAVSTRLRALRRGQWLVRLPAGFDETEPRPFLVGSAEPPTGGPASARSLTEADRLTLEAAIAGVHERTLERVGLTVAEPGAVEGSVEELEPPQQRVDTALPYTKRLPPCTYYDPEAHALVCLYCGSRYDASLVGLRRAIDCCSSMDEVDRDDVPICDLNLKLTPDERLASDWSDRQLLFLQAVYNATQLRYDRLEYDLVFDSMLRLQEYVGIDTEAVQDLLDAGVLRHDTDHPHRLFSVTPDGRQAIGEQYREGVDYGHGLGDLDETAEHVYGVEVVRRYLTESDREVFGADVVEAIPYYDLGDGRRLDIAGLDADGELVFTAEVERINHDASTAVVDDYDKMADCGVDEAIWIVMKQADGHAIVKALNDPPDGEPRIEKSYAPTTPPQQFRIEAPGLTGVYPAEWLRDR